MRGEPDVRDEPPATPPGYELLHPLGAGGGGSVWAARQVAAGGRLVALKHVAASRAAPDTTAQLRREAALLAALDHPNVLRIHDILGDPGDPAGHGLVLVLQHAPGGSLADVLARRGRLTPHEAVATLAPVADALASAHRRGVLHRDVKPANILLTSDGAPLLADFGIARLRTGDEADGAARSRGTAEYLEPRVGDGAPPDERADVYALAVTCYEALSGRPPFRGADPFDTLAAATAGDHVPLATAVPGLPAALVRAVEAGMGTCPGPAPDAAELGRLLRRAIEPGAEEPVGAGQLAADHGADPAAGGFPTARTIAPRRPREAAPTGPVRSRTTTFGPRPRRAAQAAPATLPRTRLVAAAGAVAALAVVVLLSRGGDTSDPTDDDAVAATTADDAAPQAPTPAPDCPSTGDTPPDAVLADVDGSGCPVAVSRRGTVLTLAAAPGRPVVRYELGEADDQLLLGDWDCDGTETPALYRPATGEVFSYDAWSTDGQVVEPTVDRSGRPEGRAEVETASSGCDRVTVR